MLKRKPSFATFWLPIAAVSFAHLIFSGTAAADNPTKPSAALQQQNTVLAPTLPAHKETVAPITPKAPAPVSDEAGYMSLDQAKAAVIGLDIAYSGGKLIVHGLLPAACDKNLSIHNSIQNSDIQPSGNVGGIAFYNNGGLQACLKQAGVCSVDTGKDATGADCERISSARSDAKLSLPNKTARYDYLNVSHRDADTNADPAGLHVITAISTQDYAAQQRESIIDNVKGCVKDGKLNDANTIMNNNQTLLGDSMDALKDQIAASEKAQVEKDAKALVKKTDAASEKDDFDYGSANDDLIDFMDKHPEQANLFAPLIIKLAGAHTKDGNPTAADVADAKERLENALANDDYKYSAKNKADLQTALNKGIPRAEDRVTFLKDEELAAKGNPTALYKFEQSYAKKIQKLASNYQKKCAGTDSKTSEATCEEMAQELSDMEQMPQQVAQQAQQNTLAQQQAMSSIFNPNQGMQQQANPFGMQQQQTNPMCMYNPTACMQSNPYAQFGAPNMNMTTGLNLTGQVNNGQAFTPAMYNNTGSMALQTTMLPSMQMSTIPTLQASGYNGIPTINNGMVLSR